MIIDIIAEKHTPYPQEGEIVKFKRREPKDSNLSGCEDLHTVFDKIRMLDAEGYPKACLEFEGIRLEF